MVLNTVERLSKPVLLVSLILTLIGSSAISTDKALCFEYSNNDSISSVGYFSSVYTIDLLAENEIIRRKADSHLNSLLQSSLLNVSILAGTIAMAKYMVEANLKIIKNLVLLKLRI